jgi:hypothetical protein
MKRDLTHLAAGLTVLLEEDPSIRKSWADYFDKCGMKLLTFDSAEAFISGFRPSGEPVEFFFDQDFGSKRGVGLRLASYVQTWPGRTGTSLVTSYLPEMFQREMEGGLLDSVYPKFPAEIFGTDFFGSHIRRRITEEGLTQFLSDSFGKLSDAFDDFERRFARRSLVNETTEVYS